MQLPALEHLYAIFSFRLTTTHVYDERRMEPQSVNDAFEKNFTFIRPRTDNVGLVPV